MAVKSEKSGVNPQVMEDMYSLVLWYLQATPKFPKSHRFTLGDRIERTCLEALETTLRAMYIKDKRRTLEKINELLDRLRLLTRLATDLRLFSLGQQEYCSKSLLNVGRQIGGWRRSLNGLREATVSDAGSS